MMNQRQIEDARFIRRTLDWPAYPFLPMRRKQEKVRPDTGVLVDSKGNTVYLINMFGLKEHFDSGKSLTDIQKIEYQSVEELLADGWMVD
jgi:hypothetical protein